MGSALPQREIDAHPHVRGRELSTLYLCTRRWTPPLLRYPRILHARRCGHLAPFISLCTETILRFTVEDTPSSVRQTNVHHGNRPYFRLFRDHQTLQHTTRVRSLPSQPNMDEKPVLSMPPCGNASGKVRVHRLLQYTKPRSRTIASLGCRGQKTRGG